MKILFVQDSLGTGGAERSNAELWYYLQEKGVQFKILLLEHRKVGIEREIINAGFDVNFISKSNFLNEVKQIANLIKQYKPDIVHTVLFKSSMRVRFAKYFVEFLNIESLVNSTYDPVRFQDPKVNNYTLTLYKYLDRFTHSKGVDHFIAITKQVKLHYQEYLKIRDKKISIIYRGRKENKFLIDREDIRKVIIKEFNLKPNSVIYIHVGRQEYQKDHLTILKAIKKEDENLFNRNAVFIFCGREGNATKAIQDLINSSQIKTSINFIGHRDDIYKLLVGSDVFVFPSLFEGLGGALIEAQAAGLPIICSNIKVFEEVVNKEENALMHQAGDFSDLGQKLVAMADSSIMREKFGKKSLDNYYNNFQLTNINIKMLQKYYSLIDE